MKKLIYLVLASIAITSCSSDNDTETIKPIEPPVEKPTEPTITNKGKFTLDNITYDVTFGLITTLKTPNKVSSTSINLQYTSTDLSKTVNISLSIFHEPSKSISGTYNLGDWRKDEVGILDSYLTSYSIAINTPTGLEITSSNTREIDGVKEGSLTIKENGNKSYTIKYNLLFENGKTSSADTTLDLLENRQ
jgi:hypothetical protein